MKKLIYVVSYVEKHEYYNIAGVFDNKEIAEQLDRELLEQHKNENGFYVAINEVETNKQVAQLIEASNVRD